MRKNLSKGQHFLIDQAVLGKEIQISNLSAEDRVLEIGAGNGILTKELVKNTKEVLSFEIDKRYKENLEEIKESFSNLNVIYDDATRYSWKGCTKIVSNIPYYLGEKIIFKSIREEIPFLVLIVGEKFKKLLEENYSKSSIMANVFYDLDFVQKIKKSSFSPPPRVNSWLIKLVAKEADVSMNFLRFVLSRKGKIKNALIYGLVQEGKTKKVSKEIINSWNLDEFVLEKPVSKMTGTFIRNLFLLMGRERLK